MTKANERQVGGDHYKKMPIEHWDLVVLFGWDYFQAQITRYIMRWRDKAGIVDLEKCGHVIAKYIEVEKLRASGNLTLTILRDILTKLEDLEKSKTVYAADPDQLRRDAAVQIGRHLCGNCHRPISGLCCDNPTVSGHAFETSHIYPGLCRICMLGEAMHKSRTAEATQTTKLATTGVYGDEDIVGPMGPRAPFSVRASHAEDRTVGDSEDRVRLYARQLYARYNKAMGHIESTTDSWVLLSSAEQKQWEDFYCEIVSWRVSDAAVRR